MSLTENVTLSQRPVIWIRKGGYQDLLFFEVGKKLYVFRAIDFKRLKRDEILAIPVYKVLKMFFKAHFTL